VAVAQSVSFTCGLSITEFVFCWWVRLNTSIWNLCDSCSFTAILSLISANNRQWSISQSAALKDQTSSTLAYLRPTIRIWSIWLWFFSRGDVQIYLWILTMRSRVNFHSKLSVYRVFSAYFGLKSPNKILLCYLGNLSYILPITHRIQKMAEVKIWKK
jgi:hypothetical protein